MKRARPGCSARMASRRAAVSQLLEAGSGGGRRRFAYQGEFLADGKPLEQARRVDNPREFAGYTLGYNPRCSPSACTTCFRLFRICRTYGDDIAASRLARLRCRRGPGRRPLAHRPATAIGRAAIDTGGFRFAKLRSTRDVNFLPGAVKYGDLPGHARAGRTGRVVAGRRRFGCARPGQRRYMQRRRRAKSCNRLPAHPTRRLPQPSNGSRDLE